MNTMPAGSSLTTFTVLMAKRFRPIEMYEIFGKHLGNAIITILYAMDIELIVLGASVRKAFSLFSTAMWEQVQTIQLKRAVHEFKIEVAVLANSAIPGAAALHYSNE